MTRMTKPNTTKLRNLKSRDSVVKEVQFLSVNQKVKPVSRAYSTTSDPTSYLFMVVKLEIDGALFSLLLKSICGHRGPQMMTVFPSVSFYWKHQDS